MSLSDAYQQLAEAPPDPAPAEVAAEDAETILSRTDFDFRLCRLKQDPRAKSLLGYVAEWQRFLADPKWTVTIGASAWIRAAEKFVKEQKR